VSHHLPVRSRVTRVPYLAVVLRVDIAVVRKVCDEIGEAALDSDHVAAVLADSALDATVLIIPEALQDDYLDHTAAISEGASPSRGASTPEHWSRVGHYGRLRRRVREPESIQSRVHAEVRRTAEPGSFEQTLMSGFAGAFRPCKHVLINGGVSIMPRANA